jgi:hypothetical protein
VELRQRPGLANDASLSFPPLGRLHCKRGSAGGVPSSVGLPRYVVKTEHPRARLPVLLNRIAQVFARS